MIVNKRQWHYKAIDIFGSKSAKDKFSLGCHTTCSYIRALVWALIMGATFTTFISAVACLLVFCVVAAGAAPTQLLLGIPFVKGTVSGAFYVFGAMTWSVAALVGTAFILSKVATLYQESQPSAEEKANLIKAAYQDKVDGICTLVTLEK